MKITTIASMIRSRLKNDFDCVIAIDGYPGTGKTSLALQLAMLIDPKFDIEKNVCYLPDEEELKGKFNEIQQFSVLLVDEAGKALYKLRWMDRIQQSINEMYMTERKQNKCTLLCIPRFTDLNEHFRNFRVMIWIHIAERGIAIAFANDKDKDTGKDPWHFEDNIALKKRLWYSKGKKVSDLSVEDRLEMEKQTICYIGDFLFEPCNQELWKSYKDMYSKYKQKDKDKSLVGVEEKGSREKLIRIKFENAIMKALTNGADNKFIYDNFSITPDVLTRLKQKYGILTPVDKKAEELEKKTIEIYKNKEG